MDLAKHYLIEAKKVEFEDNLLNRVVKPGIDLVDYDFSLDVNLDLPVRFAARKHALDHLVALKTHLFTLEQLLVDHICL
jgi:hypothetical protein